MDAFRFCLDSCGLVNLGYRGNMFTWCRGNHPSSMIRERLDRFVACSNWLNLFPSFDIRHFSIYKLDHASILLCSDNSWKIIMQKSFLDLNPYGYLMMIVEEW